MKNSSKAVEPMKAVGKKKASPTKASQRRGADAGRETIGIDLGDKVSRYAIVDASGELMEEGSFRNEVSSMEKHFGGDTKPARIAMEVGTQSAWIERELKRLGHEVIVANARELAWITASDRKNDRSDAEKLARLARADERLLKPVEHRTAEQQAELNVIRARDGIVRARTMLVNLARSLVKGFGCRLPAAITLTFGTRALTCVPDLLKPALEGLLGQVDDLTRRIKEYEQRIHALAQSKPEVIRLTTIPGVGELSALTFVLTLGNAGRFAQSRDVGAYLGMCPKQRQSGDRDPQLGISKAGNSYLRKLLAQCAHHILGPFGKDSALRRWGLAKAGAAGASNARKRAVIAVARKLAVVMHKMWRTQQAFQAFPLTA